MDGFRHLISPEGRTYVVNTSCWLKSFTVHTSTIMIHVTISIFFAIIVFMVKIIVFLVKLRWAVLQQCCLKQWPPTRSSLVQCHPTHPMPMPSIMPTQGKLCPVFCPLKVTCVQYYAHPWSIVHMLEVCRSCVLQASTMNFSSNAFWWIVGEALGFRRGGPAGWSGEDGGDGCWSNLVKIFGDFWRLSMWIRPG